MSFEKFEDTKGVVRNNQSKDRRNNGQNKRTKNKFVGKTLHRKLKTEQHNPH